MYAHTRAEAQKHLIIQSMESNSFKRNIYGSGWHTYNQKFISKAIRAKFS